MAHKNKISVMVVDVDGTLLNSKKQVTPAAAQAVEKLKVADVNIAVTSGRPARGLMMIQRELHLDAGSLIAAFNGALLLKDDFSVIEEHFLAQAQSEQVIALIEKLGLDFWFYSGQDWIVPNSSVAFLEKEEKTVQFKPKIVSNYRSYLEQVYKIVAINKDPVLVARAEKEMQKQMRHEVAAERSQPYYLDVSHRLANKGAVVERVAIYFGVSTENIATIGDMPSDVLMFEKSGLSIAMANASDEVKSSADETTSSNDDEGFARAVEEWILPERLLAKAFG